MIWGRLTRVSSSSSARSRASPSAVSGLGRDDGRGRARRVAAAACRRARGRGPGRPRRAASALRLGRLAVGAVGVAVGDLDDEGRRRRRLDGVGQERAGQPGRLALAGRAAEVRPRQDDVAIGQAGQVGGRDALGEGREQRVLVLLGRVGRRPPDADAVERAQRPQPVAARVRPAIAELGPADRRDPPGDRRVRRADVDDRLRRQPERRRAARPGPSTSVARHRAAASRPARSTCRRGSVRCGAVASGAGSSTTKTPGPDAGTGRPQTVGPSAMRPIERSSEAASAGRVIGRWYR